MVSVIITNFNDARWIGRSIDSVISQEETDLELIVVDDGSTDRSCDIIKSYASADERIRPILLDQNYGISAARNIGIKLAEGEYIAILDSDDALVPGSLNRRKEIFEGVSNYISGVNLLIGDAWIINEKDEVRGRYMNKPFHGCLMTGHYSPENLTEVMVESLQSVIGLKLASDQGEPPGWCLPSTFFFKKDVTTKFDDRFRVGEAGLFIERLRRKGRVIYAGEPFVNYRIRLNSISNSKAELTLRGINAALMSAKMERLDDPINPEEMPRPNWSQLAAWRHGRNAKAAWCNDKYFQAVLEYAIAFFFRPKDVFLRGVRFIEGSLASFRPPFNINIK
jgi:glycosyltransferase involved in cell wall biosynthesis